MARILVPDALSHSAYSAIRSLSRGGDACEVAWPYGRLHRLVKRGRCVDRIHRVADDRESYARDVLELCRTGRFDVLLPLSFNTHVALIPRAPELSRHVRLLLPAAGAFAVGNDKLETVRHCRQIGIACPQTFCAQDETDLRAIGRTLPYPVVIKARSASGVAGALRYACSLDELLRRCDQLCAMRGVSPDAFIIQEFVPGFIHDVCAVAESGDVVQMMTQVRKLMYPISGGVGAINYTTHNPGLANTARRLLESLSWSGPAQIEFKLDERDGCFKLIELNPKLWGTLALSIRAGIDFPGLIRDLALGRQVPRDRSYQAGLRYKFLFSRGILAYRQLQRKVGWSGLRDPQTYVRTYYDFDFADPLPDLLRAGATVLALASRRAERLGSELEGPRLNALNRVCPDRFAPP